LDGLLAARKLSSKVERMRWNVREGVGGSSRCEGMMEEADGAWGRGGDGVVVTVMRW
jgi:hypothetical protein